MTNTVNPPLSYQSIPIAPYGGTLPLLTGTGQSGSPGAYYAALSNGDMLLFSMFYPAFGFACLRIKQSGESCLYVSTSYKAAMTTSAPYLINTSAIQQINQTNFILNNGNGGVYYFVLPSYFSNGATYVVPDTYEFIARGIPFGTWTGSNNTAELVDQYGNPISSANVSAIYRNDWQGNQLLYPTARTNYGLYTVNIGGTGWASINGTTGTTGVTGPDGSTNASLVSDNNNAGVGTHAINNSPSALPAGFVCVSAFFKYTNDQYAGIQRQSDNYSATFDIQHGATAGQYGSGVTSTGISPAPNGYFRAWTVFSYPTGITDGFNLCVGYGYDNLSGVGNGSTFNAFGYQVEVVDSATATPSPYFPNSGASPLTLTDYTLSGTTVTFAQDPLATAKTTWYGTGVSAPDLVTPCGVGSLINSFYDAISGLAAYEFAQSFPDASHIYASIYEGSG